MHVFVVACECMCMCLSVCETEAGESSSGGQREGSVFATAEQTRQAPRSLAPGAQRGFAEVQRLARLWRLFHLSLLPNSLELHTEHPFN